MELSWQIDDVLKKGARISSGERHTAAKPTDPRQDMIQKNRPRRMGFRLPLAPRLGASPPNPLRTEERGHNSLLFFLNCLSDDHVRLPQLICEELN
jgi:hypothetical protein